MILSSIFNTSGGTLTALYFSLSKSSYFLQKLILTLAGLRLFKSMDWFPCDRDLVKKELKGY